MTTPEDLPPREHRVARRVAEGKSYDQIADEVGLSKRTVRFYTARVADRIGSEYGHLPPKTAVMKWYLQEGEPA